MNLEKKRFTFSFTYSDSLLSFYNHYACCIAFKSCSMVQHTYNDRKKEWLWGRIWRILIKGSESKSTTSLHKFVPFLTDAMNCGYDVL